MFEKVSVADLQLVGKGKCGNVYALSEDRIIKTFNSFVDLSAVEKERNNAQRVHSMGIPTPQVYDIVTTQEGLGLIYERVDAPSLEHLMHEYPSRFPDYSRSLGRLCRKIHSIDAAGSGFMSAKAEFLNRLELSRDRICLVSGEESFRKIERLVRAVPDTKGIVHGDFHPDNVLVKDGKLILIDMADVTTGHPVFDLLSLYFLRVNKIKLWEIVEDHFESFSEDEKIKISEILEKNQSTTFSEQEGTAFWTSFMEGYLGTDDQELISRVTKPIADFSYLYMAFSERSRAFLGEEIVNIATKEGVTVLLERMDQLTDALEMTCFIPDKGI